MTPDEALAEVRRLRDRIVELEAELAMLIGTLERQRQSEPASFTWNEPPTTPGNELP